MNDHEISVQSVELLGVTAALIDEQPVLVLAIRPDPDEFNSINLALSVTQGERLIEDIRTLLRDSQILGRKNKRRK